MRHLNGKLHRNVFRSLINATLDHGYSVRAAAVDVLCNYGRPLDALDIKPLINHLGFDSFLKGSYAEEALIKLCTLLTYNAVLEIASLLRLPESDSPVLKTYQRFNNSRVYTVLSKSYQSGVQLPKLNSRPRGIYSRLRHFFGHD